jgi:ATP-dependent exoDNAse (exonuclease V) alpha subunit
VNRRSFAESLALAALAPALGVPVESLRLRGGDLALDPASPLGPGQGEDESAASLALMLVEIIRLEYGSRLTSAELAGVAEQIQAGLDRADLIRRADRSHGV